MTSERAYRSRVAAYERQLILEALRLTGGHQARAATLLGVRATTLCEKMKRLGIDRARPAPPPASAAPAPAQGPAPEAPAWRRELEALLRQVELDEHEVQRLKRIVARLAARRAAPDATDEDDPA